MKEIQYRNALKKYINSSQQGERQWGEGVSNEEEEEREHFSPDMKVVAIAIHKYKKKRLQ